MRTSSATDSTCIFFHDVGAMEFDGRLADLEVARDLFVEPPSDHERHDVPFARREPRVALA